MEADKGSAVVVWVINDYRAEAERQLSEVAVYELIEYHPIENLTKVVDST